MHTKYLPSVFCAATTPIEFDTAENVASLLARYAVSSHFTRE